MIPQEREEMGTRRFIELLRNLLLDPISYSGRGMYGRQCVGVVVDNISIGLGAMLVKELINEIDSDYPRTVDKVQFVNEDMDWLLSTLERTRNDNMGMGYILYWPEVGWPVSEK